VHHQCAHDFRRPFWLSPRQVVIVPVAGPLVSYEPAFLLLPLITAQNAYAEEVGKYLSDMGLYVDVDTSPETLGKKIRNGEIAQYNFILGKLTGLLFMALD
jgi:threonyl-tRNA synthetase